MAIYVTFSILEFLGREFNEKLALSLMLIVISGGGALTNICLFSMPISLWFKVFSLAVLTNCNPHTFHYCINGILHR
ncbi:MAG: hypothetical protein RMK50_04250 [Nitrososphaerota archaeon]|nr:hypothetical protein [Candidatus Bathyarchaeota archaeon]MDW8194013.1 hypothetical protein [Nitrososphaerota archaeon]